MSAFSFSKQKKQLSFAKFDKEVPNVGKYNVTESNFNSRVKTAPSISLPKAPRDVSDKMIVPGPGAYQTDSADSKYRNKGASMKGTHEVRIKTQGPSPGQYNPKVQFPTKKFSFSKSKQSRRVQKGPEPGTYNANYEILNKTSNCIFSKSERQPWQKKSWMKNVGPGYTQVKQKLIVEQRNQFSFPKRQKFKEDQLQIKEKSTVPGPGKYDIHNARDSKKSVKFALATRTMNLKQQVPGPGTYKIPETIDNSKASVAIGNSPRQINSKTVAPGPGAYEIENALKVRSKQPPTVVFPKEQRMKSPPLTLVIGPGQYDIPSEIESVSHKKGFSIKGRVSRQKIQKTPGPQAYDPDYRKIFESAERSIFGKEKRQFFLASKTPGPGAYEPNRAKSNSLDTKKQTGSIGPGQYKLKPFIGEFEGRDRIKTKTESFYV